ncbi:MAG: hypothetical protein WCW14_03125 [Candidatus Paceibacterota bacterium]|jgi:uncharacterized membrane protein
MDETTNTPPVVPPTAPVPPPPTGTPTGETPISNDKTMGILSYLSILVLIPIFTQNKSEFVKFHANQGLILLITHVIGQVVLGSFVHLYGLVSLFSILILALIIIGIMNVLNNQMKQLPVIGGFKILN